MRSLQFHTEQADASEPLSITHGEFNARLIDPANDDEVRAYQRLRYEAFVIRKGWVEADSSNPGCETDRYDPHCHHVGVFLGSSLVAYLRVLPWQESPGFMLQHEFQDLIAHVDADALEQPGSAEISRLVVAGPAASGRGEIMLAELLFKLVYCLGKRLMWTRYYIVLEEAWLRVLNRRFALPFAPLGVPHTYPEGTRTLAAVADCEVLERAILAASPRKYDWYRHGIER